MPARCCRRRCFIALAPLLLRGFSPRAHATAGVRPAGFTLRGAPGAPWRGTFRLADHLGRRPVFIHFLASWCRPCELEMAALEKARAARKADEVVVVGIAIDDPQTAPAVGAMARRLGVTYPIVLDSDSTVTARLNPRRICPFSILVDRRGFIVREKEGWTTEQAQTLALELDWLAAR